MDVPLNQYIWDSAAKGVKLPDIEQMEARKKHVT